MMKTGSELPTPSLKKEGLFATGPTIYTFIVIVAFLIGYAYYLRHFTILSCQADLYNSDRYLSDCEAEEYGDYEHGAFWFDLEPAALEFAGKADVLFLGTSRVQMAFSTQATADWFSAASRSYYLMGFGFDENVLFTEGVLSRIHPKAAVYVINVDEFFRRSESRPMNTILHDPNARDLYEMKRRWQGLHRAICTVLSKLCGNNYVIFRSRKTGAYTKKINKTKPAPASYDEVVSPDVVKNETAAAISFFAHQDVKRECVILTMVPTVETKIGNANAIAKALGMDLIVPENMTGIETFDGSHLDQPSAERWSRAFLQSAGPKIQSCFERQRVVP